MVKIILDVFMALLLILMYKKMAVSLSFHEIGGLAVFGLFLIHKLLNLDWVVGTSKRIFKRSLPGRTRFAYLIDLLLLLCMIFIILSGILISKTILTSIYSSNVFWKLGHYFISAAAIILLGVHIGLNWPFITKMFAGAIKLPRALAKPLGIICVAALLVFGGYSLVTSNLSRWLTGPFTSMTAPEGERLPESQGQFPVEEEGEGHGQGQGQGKGLGRSEVSADFDLGQIFEVIVTYGSITAVFAALTLLIERTIAAKNRSIRTSHIM